MPCNPEQWRAWSWFDRTKRAAAIPSQPARPGGLGCVLIFYYCGRVTASRNAAVAGAAIIGAGLTTSPAVVARKRRVGCLRGPSGPPRSRGVKAATRARLRRWNAVRA